MRPIIFALFLSFSTAALAQDAKPIELAPDAPDHHVVVRGDTLWGISAKFLKDPFRWPEVWKMNAEQVKNPHRIYPGQVVILDKSGAQPQFKLGEMLKIGPQVRAEKIAEEIPSIPPQVIEPYLSQPLVIEPAGFEGAPRIVSLQEGRVLAGNGDTAFATGIDPKVAAWQVYRPGQSLVDPDNGQVLGIEAIFLGNAQALDAAGDVKPVLISSAKQEIYRGDRLTPASRPDIISYSPRAPAKPVTGRVLALYNRTGQGGPLSVISLTRGSKDGLEPGHVLALHRAGATVTNRFDGEVKTDVLPDERYGLVFVFRVFERVSYALVLEASRPVITGDRFGNP
jgi:nucleoid-associated protein YgaU